MKKRPTILSDHKRQGSKLIPPFVHMLGRPLVEISWIRTILPELVWIALLHNAHGHRQAVQLITSLSRQARIIKSASGIKWFAAASHYSDLTSDDFDRLKHDLRQEEILVPVQEALMPLIRWYPECPLAPILSARPRPNSRKASLSPLKELISSLYDRSARDPMMAQATAIWLAFDADILKVSSDMSIARFPEIEHYPETEISQNIGASIRSGLNVFFSSSTHYASSKWPAYFWNRGIEVDPCELWT
jgi:hypothetical protein